MNSMDKDNKIDNELKDNILNRIEQEKIHPIPRSLFAIQESLVWFLWIFSILVGAVAVAVTLFVLTFHQYAFFEATHDTYLDFALDALPYLWFSILVLMIVLSTYNFHHTKRGYRYPLWLIVISSLCLSFLGGAVLHMSGVGFNFDKWLGNSMVNYESQEKMEKRLWQQPESGRLVGTLINNDSEDTSVVWFEDIDGKKWQTVIYELDDEDRLILNSGKIVKMIGEITDINSPKFHACGVFPWLYERNHTLVELGENRHLMFERISYYNNQQTDISNQAKNLCANMVSIHHMNARFGQ